MAEIKPTPKSECKHQVYTLFLFFTYPPKKVPQGVTWDLRVGLLVSGHTWVPSSAQWPPRPMLLQRVLTRPHSPSLSKRQSASDSHGYEEKKSAAHGVCGRRQQAEQSNYTCAIVKHQAQAKNTRLEVCGTVRLSSSLKRSQHANWSVNLAPIRTQQTPGSTPISKRHRSGDRHA